MPSSSLFLRSSTTLVSVASLFSSVLAVPAVLPRQATTPVYSLDKTYAGSTFFDDFTFFDQADPTHGFVTYGNRDYAQRNGLIGFDGDYAVMSIDSTSNLGAGKPSNYYAVNGNGDYWLRNGVGRKSVRIEGNHVFTHGLIITDVGQMPSGICGTWPAFWTLGGQSAWPADGEIDIIEGANKQGGSWSALHTEKSSNINNNRDAMTGQITATNCQTNLDLGAGANFVGCKIEDRDPATYDSYTGGVWASQWTSERIRIWYWPYGRVPADVTAGAPKPASWGTPRASYAPPENLNADANFRNHHIIFDTTFCGDLGDATWATSGCQASTGFASCADYVANKPSAFSNAKWKVKYVKIYKEGAATSSPSSSSVAPSTSSVRSSTSSIHPSSSSVVSSASSAMSSPHSSSSSAAAPSSSSNVSSISSAAPSSSSVPISSSSWGVSSTSSVALSSSSIVSSSSSVYVHDSTSSIAQPSTSSIASISSYDHSSSSSSVYSSHEVPIPSSSSESHHGGHGDFTSSSVPAGPTKSYGGGYGDDNNDEPKPTSSKPYDGGHDGDDDASPKPTSKSWDGGYGGEPIPTSSKSYGHNWDPDYSKPATTSSKPYGGDHDAHPVPTSSQPSWGGDDNEEQCVTSTIITTTQVPCATPPYWEITTTTYVTSTTIYVKPSVHVEDHDYDLVTPTKAADTPAYSPKPWDGVQPAKPHVEVPVSEAPIKVGYSAEPSAPVKPAAPSKDYSTPVAPVAPVAPSSKPYAAADSWQLAGATPTGGKYYPTTAYNAKPAQFTGGALQSVAIGSGFVAAAVAVVGAVLM